MRKISCLVIISLFCLSSILPAVNSYYIEKEINDLENSMDKGLIDSIWLMQSQQMISNEIEFYRITYQEYMKTSKNDNTIFTSNSYSNNLDDDTINSPLERGQDSLLLPKIIYGTATKEDGHNADNALVRICAKGYPDKTTIVSGGAWQVDIGPDSGIEWPDGTSFNVSITLDVWKGFTESVVQGILTNVGEVVLYPTTLVAEVDFKEDCYINGDKIQFYGNAYGGKPPYSWSWDFGDGGTSISQNPIHQYSNAGTYNACLTVVDNTDKMNTSCVIIKINNSITADTGGPYTGNICYCIHFFGLPIGGCLPYSYSWDFDNSDGIQIDSTEKNPYHYYDTPGMYIASLTISDGRDDSHTNTTTITISSECVEHSPWPMSCHDVHHTGRSPYSTADNVGKEVWRFYTEKLGKIDGGPVIDNDGIIYFGTMNGYLYALYTNGTLKWKYKISDLIWSTPAIAEDGTIYIGSFDNYFYAINPNGTFKWRFDTKGSIGSSPAIANDGTVYFGNMGFPDSGGCKIFALNPNGTEKWHYQTDYKIASAPAIGNDGTIYIGSGDNYLYALNPDGTLKWRFKTGGWVKSHPSIADDGTIYFDSFDGYFYALYPDGTMRWRLPVGSNGCASASIDKDGIIYIGGGDLYAIYPNGTIKWNFNLGIRRYLIHASPAISSDGIIYCGICIY